MNYTAHEGKTEKTPGKGRLPSAVPHHSRFGGTSLDVLFVSMVGADPTSIFSSDESSSCSGSESVSSNSSKFAFYRILSSSSSSSILDILAGAKLK